MRQIGAFHSEPSKSDECSHTLSAWNWSYESSSNAGRSAIWYLISMAQLTAGNNFWQGQWGVVEVHRKVVLVEHGWLLIANWVDCSMARMGTLSVHMVMTALVPAAVQRVIFQSYNDHIGGVHINATVAHNLEIMGLHWCLVTNYGLCWMENASNTGERILIADV